MSEMWNLWHGCHKKSEGCLHCYVFRRDAEFEKDSSVCDYDWVLNIREQCIKSNVPFHFKQTGAHFRKDGKLYNIPRNQQMAQAKRAGIDLNK